MQSSHLHRHRRCHHRVAVTNHPPSGCEVVTVAIKDITSTSPLVLCSTRIGTIFLAWWRSKDLLEDGPTSFYQRSIDEAYFMLAVIAEFDRWNWDCSRNNQDETKLRIEKLERMKALCQLQDELTQIQVKLSRMSAPTNDSIEGMKRKALMVDFYKELEASSEFHHDEPIPHKEEWELFEDESSREEEAQDLYIDEESQEEVYESQPLEIFIVLPPPIKHDHIYGDTIWPTPPPPTLASFLHAHRAHPSKLSKLGENGQKGNFGFKVGAKRSSK
ncbi:hypothetical protein TIFTF001_016590 [Ficus carica]|uniref:Uncharacterized protein n=1 Tax=Ficus carica TaxID=3494 RepID=A0AA88A6K1_FICCA|nr:hypothetical protein TIFTF001_016590 [Ficus carica]